MKKISYCFAFFCVITCRLLVFFGKDFCDGSPGAPISAPKDGPKGLLRLRVPPALCNFVAKKIKEKNIERQNRFIGGR
jgi:hypothetical protein